MPADLRARADHAAKIAGRSLNAELVGRIEASFLSEPTTDTLMPAKRAKELASMARTRMPEEIRKRAIDAIGRAVSLGHSETIANLSDLELDIGIQDRELNNILGPVVSELENAGYKVKCDDVTMLLIEWKS
jgi:hypothetical protein